MRKWISLALLALAATGCSFSRDSSRTITIRMPEPEASRPLEPGKIMAGPAIGSFSCYAVQVSGPGIRQTCPPEVTSVLVHPGQSEVRMRVPSGGDRRIQILGIDLAGATCPLR